MGRNNLEIKRFSEYTNDEQMEIMFHWWHYYGKLPLSFDEMDKFKKLMDRDIEFVKNAALIAWARESASQDLVRAMRGDFEGYRKHVMELASSKEFKEVEELLESSFINEVVRTYNNPEPSVPMTEEQLLAGLTEIFGSKVKDATVVKVSAQDIGDEPILTSEKVHEIYKGCLLKEEELVNGVPNVDFTVGEGVQRIGVFNSERLSSKRDEIVAMIDELPDIEQGPSFVSLCVDKHGRQWTDLHSTMDLLMQLGVAVEAICYPLPREIWPVIGGVPLVLRTHEKDDLNFTSHKPKEFQKVKYELANGTYKKDAK